MGAGEDAGVRRALRVLVADDEQPVRFLVRVNLEVEGMEVDEAADGQEAVELALAAKPDVAVLDVMMPRLDGFEVAARLRAQAETSEVALVFLSAVSDRNAPRRAAELGALFVPKPFNPVELPPIVRRAAASRA